MSHASMQVRHIQHTPNRDISIRKGAQTRTIPTIPIMNERNILLISCNYMTNI